MASDIIEAAKLGNLQQMALLVKAGQDVNEKEPKEDTTALYWAACCGQAAACDWLIRNGADINQQVKWKSTPLHAAVDRENVDCTILLIRSGAKLNIKNNNGDTPLHKAAYRGNVRICNFLLHGGASVTMRNVQDKTPKAEAQSRRHYHVFDLLAKWENDAHLLCKMGDTHCCQYSMTSNTAGIDTPQVTPLIRATSISERIPPTRSDISPTGHPPVQESFNYFPQTQYEAEPTADVRHHHRSEDVSVGMPDRNGSGYDMLDAPFSGSQYASNSSRVVASGEGHSNNVGQGQQSPSQKAAENSSQRKKPERTRSQLEEYVFQLQVKLTEKIDRVEKLEKDRRQVISGLTRFRDSLAELKKTQKENVELHKRIETTEQKYRAAYEELTAVKAHNHHMAVELDRLKERLDGKHDATATPQTSGDWLSSDDFSVTNTHRAAFSMKFLARGASSPELTALSGKADTVAEAKGVSDLYSATLPVFRSIDRSSLVTITARLREELTARSSSWNQHLLLDIPGRPWQRGVDYEVVDGLPTPDAQDPEREFPSTFSVRVYHKDKNYVLKVCKSTEESSSGRSEQGIPPHQNVVPTLHSYNGSLLTLLPSHDVLPPNPTDYKATFAIIPNYSETLDSFFSEHRKRHPHPPYKLPERFYLHLLFELLMVALHLERHLVEKCLNISDIFLDDHLQVKFGNAVCSLMHGGQPCGTEEHSEESEERESSPRQPWDKSNVNRIGKFFLHLFCYGSDESVAMTTRLSWLPFKFRSILLGMASREETLSSREAFIRTGLLLFGPRSNDITCLLDCEIWLQTRMLILLSQKHQKMFSVTTAAESIIQNDPLLDAEFLSHVTAEEVWKHYTE